VLEMVRLAKEAGVVSGEQVEDHVQLSTIAIALDQVIGIGGIALQPKQPQSMREAGAKQGQLAAREADTGGGTEVLPEAIEVTDGELWRVRIGDHATALRLPSR
jgi:hypothetical protein